MTVLFAQADEGGGKSGPYTSEITCPEGAYMLVPGEIAECGRDPSGNVLCSLHHADGTEIDWRTIECVADCPLGYKRVIRYSGAYESGQVKACLRKSVIDEIERAQPGTIELLGPSTMEIATIGAMVAVGFAALSLIGKGLAP